MSQGRIDSGRIFPAQVTGEALTPGLELGPTVFGPLTRADIVRYAGASGDFNPLHTDDEYARAVGAPGVFVMGMLPGGYLATAVSGWFGGPLHLRRFKVRFTARVWPGDEIVCSGKVVSTQDGLVKAALEALRRGPGPAELGLPPEEVAITGEADVELLE